jgi:hypothetical protein
MPVRWRRVRDRPALPAERELRVMGRRTLACLATGLALLGAARPAFGQSAADVSAARDLFIEGSKLSGAGDWVNAQDRFERSLKLKHAPITLFSLAVVETHTGRLVEALEHLRAFLAEPSVPSTKPYEAPAATAIADLERRVGRCALVITPRDLPDLAVTIDGEAVPTVALGLPRVVNPGAHVVLASARGFRGPSATCAVAEGGTTTVTLRLDPVANEAPNALPQAPPPLAPRTEAPPEAPSRALPFSLIGGGAAVLVAGLTVGLLGVQQAASAPTRNGPAADSARTKGIAGDVLGSVGIAGAGVGVILLVVQARQGSAARPSAVTLTPRGPVIAF